MTRQVSRLNQWRETSFKGALGDVWSFLVFAFQRFINERMSQAAGALTYSTLLALVPLLVIIFAVLSSFPAFDSVKVRVEDLLLGTLVPEVGAEVKTYLTDFTSNASNLTAAGIIALGVTAVLLLSTIEATLNSIWRVDRQRPLLSRLLMFWAILTVGPLLLGASFSLSGDSLTLLQNWARQSGGGESITLNTNVLTSVLAVLAQSAAFTILFMLVPARQVRIREAAIGGVFAGIGFEILSWGFNTFLTSGSTYETVYGAVAAVPIFLVWIYMSWTVIILGAVLASSFPDWWRRRDPLTGTPLSPPEVLAVALALLSVLARQSKTGGTLSPDILAKEVPLVARDSVAERLLLAGYIVETADEHMSLARDLHGTTVADLARDLKLALGLGETDLTRPGLVAISQRVAGATELLSALRAAEDDILGTPLAEVIEAHPSLKQVPPKDVTAAQ